MARSWDFFSTTRRISPQSEAEAEKKRKIFAVLQKRQESCFAQKCRESDTLRLLNWVAYKIVEGFRTCFI